MNGVIFNEKHTFRDWGLLLRSKPQITPPVPKLKMIPVPGSDIIIDLTEQLTGEVHYEPRTIAFEFVTGRPREMWDTLHSNILNHMHGRRVNIIFDDDPNWYYTGRVTVGNMEGGKRTANLTMTATVEPYKRACFGEGRTL